MGRSPPMCTYSRLGLYKRLPPPRFSRREVPRGLIENSCWIFPPSSPVRCWKPPFEFFFPKDDGSCLEYGSLEEEGVSDQNSNIWNVCLISVSFFAKLLVALDYHRRRVRQEVWLLKGILKRSALYFHQSLSFVCKKALFCSYCVLLCFINKCFIFLW